MAYGTVPANIDQMNPADRNNAAIRAGYTGWDDYLNNRGSTQSGGSSGLSSAEQTKQALIEANNAIMDKYAALGKEFDAKNPFAFDEAQASASATERYNPYYSAELQDFTQGIERQKQSQEGSMKLLTDLNRIQVGQDKRNLDEAVSAAEEGYAGAGLYNSGAKERGVGQTMITGQDTANQRSLNYNAGIAQGQNTLGGLGEQLDTGVRELGAQKTTDIQTEIERQKAEEEARWNTERAQYIGPMYNNSITGGVGQMVSTAFSNY